MGNVVERNNCHCKLNKAVITQIGEVKHASLFFLLSATSFINFSLSEQFFCKADFDAIDSATF